MKYFTLITALLLSLSANAEITIKCGPMVGKHFMNNEWSDDKIERDTLFVVGENRYADILNDEAYSYKRDGFEVTVLSIPTGVVFLAIYSNPTDFLMDVYSINSETQVLTLTRKKSVSVNGNSMEWSSVYTGRCDFSSNK